MSQPAAEYVVLLKTIERLSFELGQIEVDLVELRRRAYRLETRIADLARPVVDPTPAATVEYGPSVPVALVPPVSVEPQAADTVPSFPTVERPAVGGPSFIRIVPATSVPVAVAPDVAQPPIAVEPVGGDFDLAAASTRPSFWSRVPDRYRKAAWIGAPIAVVMVASTWMTSAGSGDTEPTTPAQVAFDVSPTATISAASVPSQATSLPMVATSVASATATDASSPSPATTATFVPIRLTTTPSASSTATTGPATGTAESPATSVPSPTRTATVAETATTAPSPTTTSEPATVVSQGELVPGGVGSTNTAIVETFGTPDGEQDGRSSFSGGSVLVSYGPGSLAVRLTFVLDIDDLEMQLEDAEMLVSYYRPPDAQLLTEETVEPGFVRRIYTSPTLAALFGGSDTGGRAADRYVEEVRFDPATQRARLIEMALGERP
jgi:hypothetical protein